MNSQPLHRQSFLGTKCLICAVLALMAPGQGFSAEGGPKIDWTIGPAQVDLGGEATLQVPAGYRFSGAAGAKTWQELNENIPNEPAGVLIPPSEQVLDPKTSWTIYFWYDNAGYVRDDEKDSLPTGAAVDAMLEAMRKSTDDGNTKRRQRGWPDMTIVGWEQRPFYDSATHHVTWAVRHSSSGIEGVNYDSRVLGRRGLIRVKLVVPPDRVTAMVPTYNMVVGGIAFKPGGTYAEYRQGDKVAEYGLTALITGGTAVAAVKLWKPLLALGAGIVAVIAAAAKKIRAFFTGRSRQPATQPLGAPTPAPAGAGPGVAPDLIVTCPYCGQQNRLRSPSAGGQPALCGQCHTVLPVT